MRTLCCLFLTITVVATIAVASCVFEIPFGAAPSIDGVFDPAE